MKKNLFLFLLCCLLHHVGVHAQESTPSVLDLTHQKTTSLIFPYPIKSVDRGSPEILAQVPAGVENILQVKAALPGMQETNLSVITADGRLYVFDVRYRVQPTSTRLIVESPLSPSGPARFPGIDLDAAQERAISDQVVAMRRAAVHISARAGGTRAMATGFFLHGNTLFCRLVLTNRSTIPYELDHASFTLRDRRKLRRTATQEESLLSRHTAGPQPTEVTGNHPQVVVFAFDKITVSPDKFLVIDLFENKGSRHLQLRIRGRHLLRALPLPLE